jgi:hypothetical protein
LGRKSLNQRVNLTAGTLAALTRQVEVARAAHPPHYLSEHVANIRQSKEIYLNVKI